MIVCVCVCVLMLIYCTWLQKLPKRYHGVQLESDVSYIVYYRQLKVSAAPDALWNMASIHTLKNVVVVHVNLQYVLLIFLPEFHLKPSFIFTLFT